MFRWLLLFLLVTPVLATAQHIRIYAVVTGNDDPANNMAGSSLGSGLWQSDDSGRTWDQLGWKHIKAFSVDQDSNGRRLFLAAGNGVLKSTDFGETWKVMTDWRVAEVMDVMIHPRKPNLIIAATAHGVIRSTNAGVTWKSAQKGIRQPYTSRVSILNDLIYVCSEDGLYSSSNDGVSWMLVEGSPGAIRTVTDFKDLLIAGGDSSIAVSNYQHAISKSANVASAIWDIAYWPAKNVYLVSGINGVAISSFSGSMDFDGPKNVHAIATLGQYAIAGTLGDGLMISNDLVEWRPFGLAKSQVWRIKTALVP